MNCVSVSYVCASLACLVLNSCRAFDYKPDEISHRNFKATVGVKRVSAESLLRWAEDSQTSAPYREIPYIVAQELKVNSNQIERQRISEAYVAIYKKLDSGGYGMKRNSTIFEGGEERVYSNSVDVSTFSYLYKSVVKQHLQRSEHGEIQSKGEKELRLILGKIDP